MSYIKLFHTYISPTKAVMMFGSTFGWIGEVGSILLGTVIGFPAMIWTSILYGAGLASSGTSIYETIIVGCDVAIDFTGFYYSVGQAS